MKKAYELLQIEVVELLKSDIMVVSSGEDDQGMFDTNPYNFN